MNKIMTYMLFTHLNPFKGRIAFKRNSGTLDVIAPPGGGLGVKNFTITAITLNVKKSKEWLK